MDRLTKYGQQDGLLDGRGLKPVERQTNILDEKAKITKRTKHVFYHQSKTIMKRDVKILTTSIRFLIVFVIT